MQKPQNSQNKTVFLCRFCEFSVDRAPSSVPGTSTTSWRACFGHLMRMRPSWHRQTARCRPRTCRTRCTRRWTSSSTPSAACGTWRTEGHVTWFDFARCAAERSRRAVESPRLFDAAARGSAQAVPRRRESPRRSREGYTRVTITGGARYIGSVVITLCASG
jgi:hypothetical protein